jgi:hypothetical protein
MPEFGNGEQALGCFNLLEVARHVGSQDHVNDERSEFPELFTRQIDQYVAIFFPHQSVFDQSNETNWFGFQFDPTDKVIHLKAALIWWFSWTDLSL